MWPRGHRLHPHAGTLSCRRTPGQLPRPIGETGLRVKGAFASVAPEPPARTPRLRRVLCDLHRIGGHEHEHPKKEHIDYPCDYADRHRAGMVAEPAENA